MTGNDVFTLTGMPRPLPAREGDSEACTFIRHILQMSRMPTEITRAEMSRLPRKIAQELKPHVEMKACYNNSYTAACILDDHGLEPRYVLGYWFTLMPIEHAFIRSAAGYHDPTYELVLAKHLRSGLNNGKGEHYPLVELTLDELRETMAAAKIHHPPSMFEVARAFARMDRPIPWVAGFNEPAAQEAA